MCIVPFVICGHIKILKLDIVTGVECALKNMIHRCGMCIEEYDHHCDWVGKCIGKKNMSDFYFIMIWIVMVIVYFIAAFVIVHNNWFEYQRYLRYVKKMNETKNK